MQNNKNKTIGVMFGGQSPEHEISIISGELVISELKKKKINVIPIYITKGGRWVINNDIGQLKFFAREISEIKNKLNAGLEYLLDINQSVKLGKLVLKEKKSLLAKNIVIDTVFPVFHGQNGEDGTIQGLLEFLNIVYIGNGVSASAVTMDKALTLNLIRGEDLPTVKFIVLQKDEKHTIDDYSREVFAKLQTPFFVKPARLGSSIGIAKANNEEELRQAIEVAFSYDHKIVVEEAVENLKDLTCAVRERKDGKLQASLVQESVFSGDFFNYNDKYIEEGGAQLGKNDKKLVIPADIDKNTAEEIQNLSKKVFKIFDCSGMIRVDFLYDTQQKKIYVGEVNTIPGTLYHHLWEASGVPLGDVIDDLIKVSKMKYESRIKIDSELNMEILNNANSLKLQHGKK